jgi:formate dehydrogenase major subunit
MMAKPGMTVSRWIDGVMEKNELIDQDSNLRAIFFWGHAPNSQSRGSEMIEAMKKLDLMVVLDPYPSASAAMFAKVRKDGAYLLPVATQFETEGSVTASNRSLQWRERVIEPLFESRTDHMIMYQLAQKLGFGDQFIGKKDGKQNLRLVKGKGGMDEPVDGRHTEERDQRRLLDHRLHRPVARAHPGAHAEHARVRREVDARARRQGREDRL